MRIFYLPIILLVISVSSVSASGFSGKVQPILSPVYGKILSIDKSNFKKNINSKVGSRENQQIMTGILERKPDPNGGFLVIYSVKMAGNTISMAIKLNQSGHFNGLRKLSVNGEIKIGREIENFPQYKIFSSLGKAFIQAVVIPFIHERGVKTGTHLPFVNISVAPRQRLTLRGVVKGMTDYKGNRAVVIDYDDSEMSINGIDLSLDGYGLYLLDIGILVESFTEADVVIKGQFIKVKEVMNLNINLPKPKDNEIETKLEKLKKLLDMGLISEDEARTKRKEILDNL